MADAVNAAYVSVGSNVAPASNIDIGLQALARQFGQLDISTAFESDDVTGAGEKYWNLVVKFETRLNSSALRAQLKSIEDRCDRQRGDDIVEITLDLDLLLMMSDDGDIHEHDIAIDKLRNEHFVLAPLAELLPDWWHPQGDIALGELWRDEARRGSPLTTVILSGEYN